MLFHFSALRVQTFGIKTTCCIDKFIKAWTGKFCFKNATNVLGSLTLHGPPLEELVTRTESAFRKKSHKMLHGRFVHVGKALTDLQILGCGLHQNAFGGRAPPEPAGEL